VSLPRMMDRAEGSTRRRFEEVYDAFDAGGALAGTTVDLDALRRLRPFAFEGLGRSLALHHPATLPSLWPALRRPEATLVAIGVGWANEERRREIPVPDRHLADAADGRGFQRALFHAYALGHPRRFLHPAQPDFDRGVGRGIYFALGARPALLAPAVARFPHERREALWRGVGVALAFTGGVDRSAKRSLEKDGGAAVIAGLDRGAALRAALRRS
jgi:hypothetical protein